MREVVLLNDLYAILADAICLMARNDFSMAVPPRWLAELFEMVNRVVSLRTLANKWSLGASSDMDIGCQNCLSTLAQNVENDQRRYKRQWFKFRAQEDEPLLDDTGMPHEMP